MGFTEMHRDELKRRHRLHLGADSLCASAQISQRHDGDNRRGRHTMYHPAAHNGEMVDEERRGVLIRREGPTPDVPSLVGSPMRWAL